MSKQTKALRLLVPLNLVLLYLPGYFYYYYHYFVSETREKKCARSPRALEKSSLLQNSSLLSFQPEKV